MTAPLAAVLVPLAVLAPFSAPQVRVEATFRVPSVSAPPTAVTFDQEAVPVGARARVTSSASGTGTRVTLEVRGLQPDRTYGAHVHTKPCGSKPEDAGPHYQNVADPVQPSVDPAYANPENEVWLDFVTDHTGAGSSEDTVAWRFRSGGARSVVVHEHATSSDPGHAGTAGDRLACVNVTF